MEQPSTLRYLLWSILITSLSLSSHAQDNQRCITYSGGWVVLDTTLVDEASVSISPSRKYEYNPADQSIKVDTEDSVQVCFRVASRLLQEPMFVRDIKQYDHAQDRKSRTPPSTVVPEKTELIKTPGIYKSGTISRGITVGNRQDLFVNSSLNLQMTGELADDLFINAVITDQNIPYQPEGNTQQLRDFDNVLIQLYNQKFDLKVGDIVLKNDPSQGHFLKYYKNQQGVQFKYNQQLENGWQSNSAASIALSKGKFASTQISPIEGVQGPYRLRSDLNERFIVILANSEKVFIDGRRMNRGFDRDYVIDYNTGELTFNANVVITRFTRIRVDFEYIQQYYSRSNMLFSQKLEGNRFNLYADYYRESDNDARPLAVDLDIDDRERLSNLGPEATQGAISGVDSVAFIEDQIRYDKIDTVLDGKSYELYRISDHPDSAHYIVSFTEVGPGGGDYNQISSTVNGRVYQWIAPINGVSQGNFSPIRIVPTPARKQMAVVGGSVRVGEYLVIDQELALSEKTNNLYSLDQGSQGIGWVGGLGVNQYLVGKSKLTARISYEFNSEKFTPIDRFRYIEFDRDWSYDPKGDTSSEHFGKLVMKLQGYGTNVLDYNGIYRNRDGQLNGSQHSLRLNQKVGRLFYEGSHFLMSNQQNNMNANWIRSFSDIGFSTDPIVFGYFFNLDQNVLSSPFDDRLVFSSAMHYQEHGAFARNGDSTKVRLETRFSVRSDKRPLDSAMTDYTQAQQLRFSISTPAVGRDHHLNATISYRKVEDYFLNSNDQFAQGRVAATNSFFKRSIRSNFSYGAINGRELKREYVYTPVGSGQGTHTWRDDNGDGIKDLNEFYEAINQDEKNYIKLFVPTDEYIDAFQLQYVHSLDIESPRSWKDAGAILRPLSLLSFNINLNVNQKTTSDKLSDRLNPFASIANEDLQYSRSTQRYTVFYNRSAPGIGWTYAWVDRSNKQLNVNGFESMSTQEHQPSLRWNLGPYQIRIAAVTGWQYNLSDFLSTRNFTIKKRSWSNFVTWQPSTSWRTQFGYSYTDKQNQFDEQSYEFAKVHNVRVGTTYSRRQFGSLELKVDLIRNIFEGEINNYLGYVLLDALQPGRNARFNLNWQQRLKNGLQFTAQYFGRKSEKQALIHSGTMQLTAFF